MICDLSSGCSILVGQGIRANIQREHMQMAYSYSGRGRPLGALARIRELPDELETMAAEHARECARARSEAERTAGEADGWPDSLRPLTAATLAHESLVCPSCEAEIPGPLWGWLASVEAALGRRLLAFRRAGTRLVVSAAAARNEARKALTSGAAFTPPAGFVVRDGAGRARGLGRSLHDAARDARIRGFEHSGSAIPATEDEYVSALAALGGQG